MPYTIFDHGSLQPYRLAVYLVDDSVTDRELAVEAFEDGAGRVEVTPFPDGPSVLGALRTPGVTLPDVILLDVNMPTMTGFQVLAALKDDPTLSVIPVVMLTSSADEGDVRRAYSLHANSYTSRPSISRSSCISSTRSSRTGKASAGPASHRRPAAMWGGMP